MWIVEFSLLYCACAQALVGLLMLTVNANTRLHFVRESGREEDASKLEVKIRSLLSFTHAIRTGLLLSLTVFWTFFLTLLGMLLLAGGFEELDYITTAIECVSITAVVTAAFVVATYRDADSRSPAATFAATVVAVAMVTVAAASWMGLEWTTGPTTWTGYEDDDHRVICGESAAIVEVRDNGGTCAKFCELQVLTCTAAHDDTDDNQCSNSAPQLGCDHFFASDGTSDAICDCGDGAPGFGFTEKPDGTPMFMMIVALFVGGAVGVDAFAGWDGKIATQRTGLWTVKAIREDIEAWERRLTLDHLQPEPEPEPEMPA